MIRLLGLVKSTYLLYANQYCSLPKIIIIIFKNGKTRSRWTEDAIKDGQFDITMNE